MRKKKQLRFKSETDWVSGAKTKKSPGFQIKLTPWILMLIAMFSVLLAGCLHGQVDENIWSIEHLKQIIEASGWFAPLFYISLIVLSVVISPIPGACLAIVAGMIWHPTIAGIYTIIGGFIGSVIAYFIGRILGQETVKALTGKTLHFEKNRGKIYLSCLIFLARLIPIMSFDLISYGAGIIGLPFPIYATATLLGMIPSTLLITYMGATVSLNWSLAIKFGLPIIIAIILILFAIKLFNRRGTKVLFSLNQSDR